MLEDDIFRICRLCLKSGDWAVDVFNPNGTEGFLVWIIMKELVEIQASRDDGLPHTICDECMKKLSDCKHFKFVCTNSRIEFLKFQINSGLVEHREMLEDDIFRKCRLCLRSGDWEIDVMDPKGTNGFLLWIIVKELVEIQVYQGDGLPHTICDECMKKLWSFKHFKALCINSRIEFMKLQINTGLVVPSGSDGAACPGPSGLSIPEPCRNQVQVNSEPDSNEVSRETEDMLGIGQDSLPPRDPLCLDDVKSEVSDVSFHDAEVEPSSDKEDGARSGESQKDEGATSHENCFSGFTSCPVKEESEAISNSAITTGRIGTLQGQSGTSRRSSSRGRRIAVCHSPSSRGKWTEKMVCDECGDSFECKSSLLTHISSHLGESNTTGPDKVGAQSVGDEVGTNVSSLHCEDTFALCGGVGYHMRNKRVEFVCDHCGNACAQKAKLISHIRSVHLKVSDSECKRQRTFTKSSKGKREKRFVCNRCGTRFLTDYSLSLHVDAVHFGLKPFGCNICSKSFARKTTLRGHILMVHIGERHFECEECGKAFKAAKTLKAHMLTHLEKRPYPCTLCPRSFLRECMLRSHMDSHIGRTHTCQVCAKEFREGYLLKNHMRMHSEERPYKCDQCPKAFKSRVTLKSHCLVHSGLRNHSCGVCGKKFSTTYQVKIHMRTHDGSRKRIFDCEVCHDKFTTMEHLKRHMTRHNERSHECLLCDKRFKRELDLRAHVETHSSKTAERPFKCGECSKTFRLKKILRAHVATHKGLRPHVCELCPKAYVSKFYLRVHMKNKHEKKQAFRCDECQLGDGEQVPTEEVHIGGPQQRKE